ncbi:MAG: PEGA domain-containing protein [Deltaproteobacteria bacterium]|nr:PEGA domain-containing protein [Deltaproteobacteria bacterium]
MGVSKDEARILIANEYFSLRRALGFRALIDKTRMLSSFTVNQRYGTLEVLTEPMSAKVWINENERGQSPLKIGITAGEHTVKAKKRDLQRHACMYLFH